jgi:hypothetical protein
MVSLAGYTYEPDKACFVCQHVFDGAAVLGFAQDEDGDLQVTCGGEAHTGEDWRVVGLGHLDLNRLHLASMPTVDPGYAAERESVDGAWALFRVE